VRPQLDVAHGQGNMGSPRPEDNPKIWRARRDGSRARRRGSRGDAEIAERVAGPGCLPGESEPSSPASTFTMNVVSSGGSPAHPAARVPGEAGSTPRTLPCPAQTTTSKGSRL